MLKRILFVSACLSLFALHGYAQGAQYFYGIASVYPPGYSGMTASGKDYDATQLTAAHKTFPLGSKVKVENMENRKSVEVTIIDRGPSSESELIQLSQTAAQTLGVQGQGTAYVRLSQIPEAPPTPEPQASPAASEAPAEEPAVEDAFILDEPLDESAFEEKPAPVVTNQKTLYRTNTVTLTNLVTETQEAKPASGEAPDYLTFYDQLDEANPAPYTNASVTVPITPDPVVTPQPQPVAEEPIVVAQVPPPTVTNVDISALLADDAALLVESQDIRTDATAASQENVLPAPALPAEPASTVPSTAAAPAKLLRTERGDYTIQIGAFTQEDNALALYDKVRSMDISVYTSSARVRGTNFTRVRVGPFQDLDIAMQVRTRLQNAGMIDVILLDEW